MLGRASKCLFYSMPDLKTNPDLKLMTKEDTDLKNHLGSITSQFTSVRRKFSYFSYLSSQFHQIFLFFVGKLLLFRIARTGIFPRSSLLDAGQLGFWEFGRVGQLGEGWGK
jgi:hypothetical protein